MNLKKDQFIIKDKKNELKSNAGHETQITLYKDRHKKTTK